jgi:hypothetical protein
LQNQTDEKCYDFTRIALIALQEYPELLVRMQYYVDTPASSAGGVQATPGNRLALRLLFATRLTCQWTCKIGSFAISVEGDEVMGGEGKRPPSFKLAVYANKFSMVRHSAQFDDVFTPLVGGEPRHE